MNCKRYILVVFAVIFISANVYSNTTNKDLPAPNNFTAYADTMRVGIMWEAPDSSSYYFLRYELYRSDIGKYFIFEVTPAETYFDYMVEFEEYTYWVTAVYIEGESLPSDSLTITPYPEHGSWVEDFSTDWSTTGWEEIPDSSNWQWRPEDGGYAQLSGQPAVTNYDMSLISPTINFTYYWHDLSMEINMYIDNNSTTDGEVWEIWIMHYGGEDLLWSYYDPSSDWGEIGGTSIEFTNIQQYSGQYINLKFRSHGGSTNNFECWNIFNVRFDYSIMQDNAHVYGFIHDYYYNPLENVRIKMGGGAKYYNVLSGADGSFEISPICAGWYELDYYLPGYTTSIIPYSIVLTPDFPTCIDINYGTPIINFEPDSISSQINIGVTDSMTLTLNYINMVDSLLWTASIINNSSHNSDWITFSDSAGTIAAGEEIDLQVYFDASNDTVSTTYTCDILFMVNYEVPIAEIPVILEVVNYSVDDDPEIITKMLSAFPNPFRTSTIISYNVTTRLRCATPWQANSHELSQIKIYNVKGQLVREFLLVTPSPNRFVSVTWDGLDKNGKEVTPGIYFYKFKTDEKEIIGKMIKID